MKWKRSFKFAGLALLILGIAFWVRSDFWQIRRVGCNLNGNPCSEQLWAELMNLVGGRNILFFSLQEISRQIRQNHPEFLEVEIRKQFPNGLLFEIKVRKAAVAIGKEWGDFYLVDKEGILLENTDDPANLPLIFLNWDISQNIGEKIQDGPILTAVQILYESKLRTLEPKLARAISEREIEIMFKDDLLVLFSAKKNIKEQLASLQFILGRIKIKGERVERIDLRFDKPVIVK